MKDDISLTAFNLFPFLLDLDFLGSIRLVNYIRSQVKAGNLKPDVSSAALFEDDLYMMPVLEDDALLYSLDEVSGEEPSQSLAESQQPTDTTGKDKGADKRVLELQEELDRLQEQFTDYQLAVKKSMEKEMEKEDQGLSSAASKTAPEEAGSERVQEQESGYFDSYSYNSR